MRPRDESRFRTRAIRGTQFFTSRRAFDDLTLVVKRFPSSTHTDTDTDTDTGTNFVMVHGIGVSSRYFHPIAVELARLGTVWLVDLPGYGSAPDPRREVTIGDHATVLGRFLTGASLENPVLVGHSMGSQVVSRLAIEFPDVADHIVLMSPTMRPDLSTVPRALWGLFIDGFRESWAVRWVAAGDYLFRCGVPYIARQLPHMFADRIEERLPALTARTLVLVGDRDPIVGVDWARELAASVPGSTFGIVAGPHAIMYTDPVGVASRIAEHAGL
jgi:pimeloyl-ACP methyl ester carboxylesterase